MNQTEILIQYLLNLDQENDKKKKLNKLNFIEQYINKAKPTLSTVYGIYIDWN